MSVLAVEYPGCGLYKKRGSNLQVVLKNSLQIYDCLVNKYSFSESNIVLLGRSIGSGPAMGGIRARSS